MNDLHDPRLRPWRMLGTAMTPNVLLMCKLLVAMLLFEGFWGKLTDPYLPFIAELDVFRRAPGLFEAAVKTAFVGAALLLFANVSVRPAAVVLGLTILVQILAVRPSFRNHLLAAACFLVLAGLHRPAERPWLLYVQMALIYFGAGSNKLLDADWHTGQFMHNWLLEARGNPMYTAAHGYFPDLALAQVLSWGAIAMELTLVVLLLVPRTRALGVWIAMLFHVLLFVALRGAMFGHFLQSIAIGYLAFLVWPRGAVRVEAAPRVRRGVRALLRVIDFDRAAGVAPEAPERAWLVVESETGRQTDMAALRSLVRYSSGLYVALFAFWYTARFTLTRETFYPLIATAAVVLLLFFLPVAWDRLFARRRAVAAPSG